MHQREECGRSNYLKIECSISTTIYLLTLYKHFPVHLDDQLTKPFSESPTQGTRVPKLCLNPRQYPSVL